MRHKPAQTHNLDTKKYIEYRQMPSCTKPLNEILINEYRAESDVRKYYDFTPNRMYNSRGSPKKEVKEALYQQYIDHKNSIENNFEIEPREPRTILKVNERNELDPTSYNNESDKTMLLEELKAFE